MAIYEILSSISDLRNDKQGLSSFNGYLEDYLAYLELNNQTKDYDLLQTIFNYDSSLKIITDLHLNINQKAIANQIIRYRDCLKLPPHSICIPYIIYKEDNGKQRACIINFGNQEAYILAKAYYYIISEPDNEFEGTRNEIMTTCFNLTNQEEIIKQIDNFFNNNIKAGNVQRELDNLFFNSYQEMYDLALALAQQRIDNINDYLINPDDVKDNIYKCISYWFLLKKFIYVQYMMDKSTINTIHEGSSKKQRSKAKELADHINYLAFFELWDRHSKLTNPKKAA